MTTFIQNKFQFSTDDTAKFKFTADFNDDDMSSVSSNEESTADDDNNAYITKRFQDLERKIIDQGNAPFEIIFHEIKQTSTSTETTELIRDKHELKTTIVSSEMMTPNQTKNGPTITPTTQLYNDIALENLNNNVLLLDNQDMTPHIPFMTMRNFPPIRNSSSSNDAHSIADEALKMSNKILIDNLQTNRDEQIKRF